MNEIYRIPTLEVNEKSELIRLLNEFTPECVFEHIEEAVNPVGFQWNYTLTTKIVIKSSPVIVRYEDVFYEFPESFNNVIAIWAKEKSPSPLIWMKGILKA